MSESSPNPWKGQKVEKTEEFDRILNLPRRDWEAGEEAESLRLELTELLRRPGCTQALWAVQARLLYELWNGNAIGIIPVGGGKSLISFLAPYVVQAVRPLLVVPGNLLEKTHKHLERDRKNWQIPSFIRIESYEQIRHPDSGSLLYDYKPDLLIFDEVSKAKNTSTRTAKTIRYYLEDCRQGYVELENKTKVPLPPPPKLLFLSGTLTNESPSDYWHLLKWWNEAMCPLPLSFAEFEMWANALGADVPALRRVRPGALLELCNEEERRIWKVDPKKAARKAFRRRLVDTPGIVASMKPYRGVPLRLRARFVEPAKAVTDAIQELRDTYKTPAPEEFQLADASMVSLYVRELSLGFYLRPNPRPPQEYVLAQRSWHKTARQIIASNRSRILSLGQLVRVMKTKGRYSQHMEKLEKWEEWDAKFKLNNEAVWISDYAVEVGAQWMAENPKGIVWCYHPAFGERLSAETGVSYYGAGSVDANGRYVEDHPHGTPMICSIPANYMGKNLQFGWNRSLLMHALSSGEWWEQLLGRQHREGQLEAEVVTELFVPCYEYVEAFWKARRRAEYAEDMEGPRKLIYADEVDIPHLSAVSSRRGVHWTPIELKEGQ